MNSLQKMFPSLTAFSDLDWDLITKEYQATKIEISFPEYLQQKAEEGDCPPFLFEIAFYEMATFNAMTSEEPFPFSLGIYLNPTAIFLSFEYDVPRMLKEASKGNIEIYEKPHVLCLYRNSTDEVISIELDETDLILLQHLENGPRQNKSFVSDSLLKDYDVLVSKGLILENLKN
jgi:hypothetical protein